MEEINASQLAFLLDIRRKDAIKKIVVALKKRDGDKRSQFKESDISSYEKDPSIQIEHIQYLMNIDLKKAIENIRNNFLKSYSTAKWILEEYPEKKLVPSKETGKMPNKISIPSALSSMLSEESKEKIIDTWNSKYGNLGVEFKA